MRRFGSLMAALGLCALLVSAALPCLAGAEAGEGAGGGDELEALLMEMFPTGVLGTTWQEHRLVSGAPVEVAKQVEAAAKELMDNFEGSYRKSNPQPPASDVE